MKQKSDSYTRGMLTIIALCLTILTLGQLKVIPGVSTNFNQQPQNSSYGLVPLNEDGSVTVKLSSGDRLDVSLVDINTYDELRVDIHGVSTSDELPVNIDEIGGSSVFGNKLPVTIDK